jgi:hypothetical protein
MTDKLSLYNGALREIGEVKLASLAEASERRYIIDDVFDSSVQTCLESGFWNFAMRAMELNPDLNITPTFAYQFAFQQPNDWLATAGVYSDALEKQVLTDYVFEAGYWYASVEPIYVRIVSNDPDYGGNLGKWPQLFADYVKYHIAVKICPRVTNDEKRLTDLKADERKARIAAENHNVMGLPARFPPYGSWVMSRSASRWTFGSSLRGTGRGL